LKVEPKLEPTNIETGKVEPKAEPKGKVKAEPKGKPKVESKVAPDVELKSTNATQSTRSRRSAPVKSSAEPVKATTTRRTSRKNDTLADKKEAVVSLEQLSLPANIIAEAKHNSKKQKLSVVSENDENEDTNRNDARGKRSNAGRKRMISDKSEAPPSTEVEKTASTRSNRRRTTQTSVKGNNDDVPVPKVEAAGGRKRPKSEAVLKTDQKSMENSRKNKEDGKEDAEVGQLETKKGLKRPNSEVKIKSEGQSTSRLPMTSKIEETKPKTETARGRKRPKSEAMINTGIEAPATSATGRRNARSMAPEPKPSTSNATSSRGKRTSVSKGNKPSDDVEDTLEDTRKKFKPKVMLTGYESPQDVKIIKDLGGIVSTNIKDCTVLITTKLGRTAKLLCALGRGIPIVSPNWLVQCKMTKTFLDPWKYLLQDKEAEKKWGFSLENSLTSASKNQLLDGFKVFATSNVQPSPKDLKEIIACAGGNFLTKLPSKAEDSIFIISCDKDKATATKALKAGVTVCDKEVILTGLLKQKLELDKHKLII